MMCIYYRWRISRSLDEDDERLLPRRHLERCAACRTFHERSLRLGKALRAERLPARVRESVTAAPASWRWKPIAAGALAVAAMVIIVVVWRAGATSDDGPTVVNRARPGSQATFAMDVLPDDAWMARMGRNVAEFASPASQPVIREIQGTGQQLTDLGRRMLWPLPVRLGADESAEAARHVP